MSKTITAKAYLSKKDEEFNRHRNAVKFCIENNLSFPKETSDFFKGKIDGYDLEEINDENILMCIDDGISVEMPFTYLDYYTKVEIKVSDIPKNADTIVVKLS